MRVLIQRVREASVAIGGRTKSAIGRGLLVLAGVEAADGAAGEEGAGVGDGAGAGVEVAGAGA